jgi:predicted TPR repeat methyltransferase
VWRSSHSGVSRSSSSPTELLSVDPTMHSWFFRGPVQGILAGLLLASPWSSSCSNICLLGSLALDADDPTANAAAAAAAAEDVKRRDDPGSLPSNGGGASTRTIESAEKFLELANELLAEGDLDGAVAAYRNGLEALAGSNRHHSSATPNAPGPPSPSNEGEVVVTELSLHTNLATALSSLGRDDEAIEAYQQALVAYKRHYPPQERSSSSSQSEEGRVKGDAAHLNSEAASIAAQASFYLGMVYQDMAAASLAEAGAASASANGGDGTSAVHEAIDAYRYAFHLDPLHWSAMANLGSLYHDLLMDHDRALDAYNAAYEVLTGSVEPTDPLPEPRPILSQLQYRVGLCLSHDPKRRCRVVAPEGGAATPSLTSADCKELAAHAFALAIEYDDNNVSAKHMLATLTADATMKRASNEYVTHLFDEYAANFEHSLVAELGYNGYERLRRAFDRAFEPRKPPVFDLVVDAGCGTGLVGMEFRNVSRRLIGVDLSKAIVDQAVAKRPKLYDETLVGDVMEVFKEKASAVDLIVAGDSFIYFGDLDPMFAAMQAGLANGGVAAFTLENVDTETELALEQSKPDWRWQLTASGRFAHRRSYVTSAAESHGLELFHYERMDGFRHERGKQVRGHVFVVRKGRPDQEL